MKQTKLIPFKIILIYTALIFLYAVPAYPSTSAEDTIVTVSVKGVKKQFKMPKGDLSWLKDFQHFINSCKNYTYTETLKDDFNWGWNN